MNAVHVHLLLNHLPVIGSLIAAALLIVALLRRDSGLAKVTLGLFVALAGIAVVVFLTGEPAEERRALRAGVAYRGGRRGRVVRDGARGRGRGRPRAGPARARGGAGTARS